MQLKVPVLSKSAIDILVNAHGYRSDDYSDTDLITSNVGVLYHEINDLENDDIIDFVEDHYGLQNNVTRDIDEYVVRDSDGRVIQDDLVREIDQRIREILHSNTYDLIWICDSKQDVQDSDYAEDEHSIYRVDLPDNPKEYAIVSDLGKQGCLIAYIY